MNSDASYGFIKEYFLPIPASLTLICLRGDFMNNTTLIRKLILACVFGLFVISTASAKDLSNRLGVGYSNQFSVGMPSMAASYHPNAEIGLGASLGVSTEEDDSRFGLLFKVYRIIFPEENLNFYMGASAGILSYELSGQSESGFELNGIFGAQFFFAGLDSLAFHFEAGLGITSIDSGVHFRTIGSSPMEAGLIFYF